MGAPTAADLRDIDTIAKVFERYPDTPSSSLVDRIPLEHRRVLSLVRRFPDALSRRLGGRRVTYSKAEYHTSGSGPFGRYSSARGRYSKATFDVE